MLQDGDVTQYEINEFLKQYSLVKLCIRTVTIWMHQFGFVCGRRKKGYYVDSHEREDERNEFVSTVGIFYSKGHTVAVGRYLMHSTVYCQYLQYKCTRKSS